MKSTGDTVVRTERLVLRRWRPSDEAAMAAINRDPAVTEFLNRPMHEAAIAGFYDLVVAHWEAHGFGFWAVEVAEAAGSTGAVAAAGGAGPDQRPGTFLGFVGVAYPAFLPDVAHRPELGWRLTPAAWGRGLATEAALAARDHALGRPADGGLGLTDLISVIHPDNRRSQSVARKVGMEREGQVWNPHLARPVDVWRLR